jgi:hypothetical protein
MGLLLVAFVGVIVYPVVHATGKTSDDLIARGHYLVEAGLCNDCHTPKIFTPDGGMRMNEELLLSGHPAGAKLPEYDAAWVTPGQWLLFSQDLTACVGPWGVTCAANLTPDDQTGIGLWEEEQFVQAMRSGKHMGEGRPILPPMPWELIGKYNDDDLRAMFAYLKSIEPVNNPVPAPVLNPPPGH